MSFTEAEIKRIRKIIYNPEAEYVVSKGALIRTIDAERQPLLAWHSKEGIAKRARRGLPYVVTTIAAFVVIFTTILFDLPGRLGVDFLGKIQLRYALKLLDDWPKDGAPLTPGSVTYAGSEHYAPALQRFIAENLKHGESVKSLNDIFADHLKDDTKPLTMTLGASLDRTARKFVGAVFSDSFILNYDGQRRYGFHFLNPLKPSTDPNSADRNSLEMFVGVIKNPRSNERANPSTDRAKKVPAIRITLVSLALPNTEVAIPQNVEGIIQRQDPAGQLVVLKLNAAIHEHMKELSFLTQLPPPVVKVEFTLADVPPGEVATYGEIIVHAVVVVGGPMTWLPAR